ncbi:hypothetical protein INR49_022661, partial [Caranx melampygus]
DRLGALVDTMCVEAVEKILEMVEVSDPELRAPPPPPPPPAPPPPCPCSSDGVMRSQTEEGEDGAADPAPTEHTYILVYGSAAPVDSRCVLVSLQSAADADGEKHGRRQKNTGVADLPDHVYARPSSPPPAAAAADEERGGSLAVRSRSSDAAVGEQTRAWLHPQRRWTFTIAAHSGVCFQHRATVRPPKEVPPLCSVCGTRFSGVLNLREHERRDHGLLPYASHRNLHVKARHTGEKSCHCDICGKGYSSISVLKTHRVTHFDKTFTCDVCGKSFYHACHLTRHKLVHQDERPYHCSTCGKGFTQAANLRSHQAVHSGERQLCSVCGKSYRCLKNHIISKHSHELPADQLPASASV